MSEPTFRISPWQLAVLVFTVSLCVTVFWAPAVVDRQLGRAGWLALVAATAVGLWGVLAATGLARCFPGRPFDRTILELLGPVAGGAYLMALALLFVGGAAANLHVFALVATATALTHLPPLYPAVLMGGVGTLAAYFGPEVVARTGELVAPFVGAGLLALFVPLGAEAHLGRLLPVGVAALNRMLDFNVLPVAGSVRGFLPLLLLGPFCMPRPRAGPLCAVAATAGILIAAGAALPVALFGAHFTARLRYPFLAASGTLTWQWLPLHHLVVVTMLVWHAVTVVVFATYLWGGAWLLVRLCPRLPWRVLLLGLAVVEIGAASLRLPSPLEHTAAYLWNDAVVVLGVMVPTLLCALALRRSARRGGAVGS